MIKTLPIADIVFYEKNAKSHPKKQVDKLKKSIQRFGFRGGIKVTPDNVLVAGHGRIMALKELGHTEVNVEVIEDLKPEDIKAYRLADNKTAESEWLDSILSEELMSLKALDFDLSLTGFDDDEIFGLIGEEEKGSGSGDNVPEVPEEPVSKLGDIYQLGDHRVMCGDSTKKEDVEKLMAGKVADMVFTDPPYGYEYESNHQTKHKKLKNDDKILDFLPIANSVMQENSAIFVCASHQTAHKWRPLIDENFTYKNLIVWKKNNWSMGDLSGAFAGQHELIFFAHKGRVELNGERSRDVWEFDRDPPENHPTQKPVALVQFAIEKVTQKGNLVLDLFLGSGTTLIASEDTARTCYGMELDPRYVDVIVKRWEEFTGQKAQRVV